MILQPSKLFKLLKIENKEEAERVLVTTLEFLIYMKPGDKFKTSLATFEKLNNDLMHMDVHIDAEDMIDALEKSRIIKMPI